MHPADPEVFHRKTRFRSAAARHLRQRQSPGRVALGTYSAEKVWTASPSESRKSLPDTASGLITLFRNVISVALCSIWPVEGQEMRRSKAWSYELLLDLPKISVETARRRPTPRQFEVPPSPFNSFHIRDSWVSQEVELHGVRCHVDAAVPRGHRSTGALCPAVRADHLQLPSAMWNFDPSRAWNVLSTTKGRRSSQRFFLNRIGLQLSKHFQFVEVDANFTGWAASGQPGMSPELPASPQLARQDLGRSAR
jgi:hypothetical protein